MLLATTNPGKIREIRLLLEPVGLVLSTLGDTPPVPEPEETGPSFADNALLKARYYAAATGLIAIGEDSGLAIDALEGRPGVESARYPGETYPDKFRNLYRELSGHERPWTARYVCSVAIVRPDAGAPGDDILFTAEGTVDGELWPEPRGTHGFGYDPVFYYPPYRATFGEVDDELKLAVAHRGRAFRQVAEWWQREGRRATG